MRIIDAHIHLKHGDEAKTEYSPEEIVRVMEVVGIEKSVVFAMSTSTKKSIEMAVRAARKYPDRLIPYVYALPSFTEAVLSQIRVALTELGFKGIKIHAGECTIAEYLINPVIELAGELGVPCLIDCLGRYGDLGRLAEMFPETKIIVAHMGRYLCRDAELIDKFIQLAQRMDNVYLDVSGVVLTDKIVEAVRKIGAEKVIWGSDGPHRQPTTVDYAKRELDKVRKLPLKPEELEMVLGGSIAALLGI